MVSRILLLLDERRAKIVAATCLDSFELVTFAQNNISSIDIKEEKIDLIILDVESVVRYNATLKLWRQSAEPLRLSTLVILADRAINSLSANLREQLDSFISLPIDPVELEMALTLLQQVRQFSRRLSQQEENLKESSEQASRLISTVAHELRNPLSIISALTQILQRKGQALSIEKKKEMRSRIQSAIRKLAKLIESLYAFNRKGSVDAELNPKPFDLSQQCHDILNDFRMVHQGSRNLKLYVHEDFSEVCLDASLTSSILNNLLSNAIKYSAGDSTVSLSLQRRGANIAIAVQDEGRGIAAEDQAFLFDAFFRTRNAVDVEGTGLGLSIVKQCVELHGGQIDVRSQIGKGTTFIVSLPNSGPPDGPSLMAESVSSSVNIPKSIAKAQ